MPKAKVETRIEIRLGAVEKKMNELQIEFNALNVERQVLTGLLKDEEEEPKEEAPLKVVPKEKPDGKKV